MSQFFAKKPKDFHSTLEVSTVFIFHKDDLLLLQRKMDKIAPGAWCVPGGKLEMGEDAMMGLIREINEELQINPEPDALIEVKSFYVRYPKIDYRLHLFRWDVDQKPSINLNPEEHLAYRWHSRFCLKELPLLEGQYEAYKYLSKVT